jgi:hypothetical protein
MPLRFKIRRRRHSGHAHRATSATTTAQIAAGNTHPLGGKHGHAPDAGTSAGKTDIGQHELTGLHKVNWGSPTMPAPRHRTWSGPASPSREQRECLARLQQTLLSSRPPAGPSEGEYSHVQAHIEASEVSYNNKEERSTLRPHSRGHKAGTPHPLAPTSQGFSTAVPVCRSLRTRPTATR